MSFPQNGCNVWFFVSNPLSVNDAAYTVEFVSNGTAYNSLTVSEVGPILYGSTTVKGASSWTDTAYRTIIFKERPTGELLTWLQDNATEMDYSAEAWYLNAESGATAGNLYLTTNFHSYGTSYKAIGTYGSGEKIRYYTRPGAYTNVCVDWTSWVNNGYRTITLESAATGDLLTYLTANATKVAEGIQVVTYTVTFQMNGHGTQVPTQTIVEGQTATQPPNPSATGWAFGGWYADSGLTTAFDFSQAINENKTVYAKWTAIPQYTVSFNMNGHGGSIPSQTVYSGQTATQPADPEADGYIFQGWFDSALTTAFDFSTPITQNTIIHAKWYEIPVLDWNGNRYGEGYIFKRVEWPNFQEHETYDYITSGSIEYSTEADLKTAGSFEFEGYDIPDVNDLIRVYYNFTDDNGLECYEPIGTFFVNYAGLDYEDTIKGIKASGTLEGSSVLKVLQDKITGMPYTVKKNANAVYEAENLIKAAGLLTNMEPSGFVLSVDHTFDSGTDYLEMVNWLLTTAGYAEAYPDGNGTVQLVSNATVQSKAVKQTFANNARSIMYPEIEEANDWQNTPNVVRLLYNTDDACIVAEATNVTGSRASLDARGNREKTYYEEVSDIGDGSKVNLLKALAEETLKEQSCDVEYVTMSHAYVPLNILDLVEIVYSDMKWSGYADNISIDLSPSTKTQTKIKRTLYEDIVITSSATVYRS